MAGRRRSAAPVSADGRADRARPTGSKSPRDEGAPAQAVHEGTVAFADTFAGFGNLVIVDHGAQTFSLYGDLLDIGGQERRARRPRAARRHRRADRRPAPAGLYFELRVDGQPVDPLQWLKKVR